MSDKDLKNMLGLLGGGQGEENNAEARLALFKQLNQLLGDTAAELDNKKAKPARKPQPKVVRDSFTLPENDYNLMLALQDKALDLRVRATKGEILRAGLHALENLSEDHFLKVLNTVEKLKPGRRKE